jgi:hypothetical protein
VIRFKEFINEQQTFDLEKFKSDCSFFLEHIEGSSSLLWRGTTLPKEFEIRPFSPRKKSADMPYHVHTFLNAYYQRKINSQIRNWLFTTGDRNQAGEYTQGLVNPCMVFPVGNFQWFCFKDKSMKDLYIYIDRIRYSVFKAFSDRDAAEKHFYETLEDSLDSAQYWFNSNLRAAVQSGNEVMISCEEYYAFKVGNEQNKTVFSEIVLPFLEKEILNVSKRDNFNAK